MPARADDSLVAIRARDAPPGDEMNPQSGGSMRAKGASADDEHHGKTRPGPRDSDSSPLVGGAGPTGGPGLGFKPVGWRHRADRSLLGPRRLPLGPLEARGEEASPRAGGSPRRRGVSLGRWKPEEKRLRLGPLEARGAAPTCLREREGVLRSMICTSWAAETHCLLYGRLPHWSMSHCGPARMGIIGGV